MTIQEFEQLRRLHQGNLSKEEAKSLKQRITEDPEFRAEAADYLLLMHQIKESDPIRNKVKALLAGNTFEAASPQTTKIYYLARLGSAAAVVLAMGLALFLWIDKPAQFSFDLLSDELHIVTDHAKSGAGTLSQAEQDYYEKKYKAAAQAFHKDYLANPKEIILLYNYGISAYWDRNWLEAQKAFQTAANVPFAYRENAQLYWALSLLRDKKKAEAERLLRAIANDENHSKKDLAKKILEEMKKN